MSFFEVYLNKSLFVKKANTEQWQASGIGILKGGLK
jgi:hypothetical protein